MCRQISEVTMSASIHSPFLSFYDALISISRSAYDAFTVGLPAILTILDDVALAVCNVYSKSVIHGKLLFEMVYTLVPLVLQELSQSACTCICLRTYPLAFSRRRKRWDSSKTAGSHRCSQGRWIVSQPCHKPLCSSSHASAFLFFHEPWPRWMQYWLMSISR